MDGTSYVDGSLLCMVEGVSRQTRCEYDAASNSIVFEGLIGPDAGASTADDAANEIVIVFRSLVDARTTSVSNQAEAAWDSDGDGEIDGDPVLTDDPGIDGPDDRTRWDRGVPRGIPTLSEWGLLLLIALVLLVGARVRSVTLV